MRFFRHIPFVRYTDIWDDSNNLDFNPHNTDISVERFHLFIPANEIYMPLQSILRLHLCSMKTAIHYKDLRPKQYWKSPDNTREFVLVLKAYKLNAYRCAN